ncbi:MAG: bifunctional demethylmenaquinone methyltransferase/2-methoxy-6-polyprenyl-1,4-benzoquinol methylase UbiE [Candidatus Latescibacteria bacterium]|nr:bifunctional demethylmenaquinone methyltransferase/2-methoxy-6-polyprenyl-1,4-benzoquinol methylase UbiE [Candidatus Latescibacterota bacterium]
MESKDNIIARKQRIQQMFNAIARRYDLLNHLLSGGMDLYWRRRALNRVRCQAPQQILDLATGTADFALAATRKHPQRVVGVDVAVDMLRLGAAKLGRRIPPVPVQLLGGDAENLPFRDRSFDLVIAAFGVRNFGHIPTGLAEAWRVLRPGGELLILDFSEPETPLFRQLYRFYFTRILPLVGGLVSGQRQAYAYLPASVGTFPQGSAFLELLDGAGFVVNVHTSFTLGVCALYQGFKPEGVPIDGEEGV